MKYAVLSDIHANASALRRVLADARTCGAQRFVCLGDVVGYGPQPEAALSLVRETCSTVLAGNHDDAVSGRLDTADFIDLAGDAVERHRSALSRKDLAWLRSLEHTADNGDFLAAHGDFTDPARFLYVQNETDAAENFRITGAPLLFVGHTHVPQLFLTGSSGRVYKLDPTDFVLEDGKRYLVNPGSVGYPRESNGVCRSSYVLFDTDTRTVTYRFLPFEVGSVLQRGKASRRNRLLFGLVSTLVLLGIALLAFLVHEPIPSPTQAVTVVREDARLVLESKSYALSEDHRRFLPNLRLERGSAPVLLRTVFKAADGRTLANESLLVRQSRTKALLVPDGTVTADITLLRQNVGDQPKVRSYEPAFAP